MKEQYWGCEMKHSKDSEMTEINGFGATGMMFEFLL